MNTVYIVLWRYHDGSDAGAACASPDRESAQRMLRMLSKTNTDKKYEVEEVPFVSFARTDAA